MYRTISLLLFSLALLPCCSKARQQDPATTPPATEQYQGIEVIHPVKQKKKLEFVVVGGEYYPVPEPWKGGKIELPSPPASALAIIPSDHTWQGSSLYIIEEARDAFVLMAEQAQNQGHNLTVHSGFRSIGYQKKIFAKLMAKGRTWDDLVRYVAPPGYSEHMLGTVVDLYPSNWRFASTPEYQWLRENGAAFGFVESYPESGTGGYPWESWHWKYVGISNGKAPPASNRKSPPQTIPDSGQ